MPRPPALRGSLQDAARRHRDVVHDCDEPSATDRDSGSASTFGTASCSAARALHFSQVRGRRRGGPRAIDRDDEHSTRTAMPVQRRRSGARDLGLPALCCSPQRTPARRRQRDGVHRGDEPSARTTMRLRHRRWASQARFGCARSAVLPSPRGWLSRSSSRVPSGTRVRRERRCGFGIDARDGGDVRLPALFGSLQDAGEAGPHEMQSTVTSSRHDRRRRSASTVQTARFGCPALWLSLQSAREAEALPSAPPALDEVPMPTAMGPGRVLPDLRRVLESGPRPRR